MNLRNLSRLSVFALAYCFAAACSSGDGGGGPTPDYTVTVGSIGPTTLGTDVTFDVDLTSTGGFAGPVTLTVTGAPASWTVSIPGSPVTLAANGTGTATVTVTIPTNGDAAPAGMAVTVEATASSGDHSATATLTVANEYIVPIAAGTGAGAHWGALSGTTIHLKVGATLTFRNDDADGHRIHLNGTIPGFDHQAATMASGGVYSVVSTDTGADVFYCHDHLLATGAANVVVE